MAAPVAGAWPEMVRSRRNKRRLADVERRGGIGGRAAMVSVLDHPWTHDDREWFERNPKRAHRARMPFPSEVDEQAAQTPAGHALIVLVRQVEPGSRLRSLLCLNTDLLPLSDDEAAAHALFEIAARREAVPPNSAALRSLIERYTALADGSAS